jgi:hypothetical protein
MKHEANDSFTLKASDQFGMKFHGAVHAVLAVLLGYPQFSGFSMKLLILTKKVALRKNYAVIPGFWVTT